MSKYKSVDELVQKSVVDFTHKKSKDIIKRLSVMKDNGISYENKADYENAFIFFKRWLNCVNWLMSLEQYKTDKKFSTIMVSPSEIKQIKSTLEKLTKILNSKYAMSKTSTNHIAEAVEKMQIDSNNSTTGDTTVNRVLTLPEIPSEDPVSTELEDITCMQLHTLLKTKADRLLIIDVRPIRNYEESRIMSPKCINIPPEEIQKGKTATSIAKYLQTKSDNMHNLFRHRGKDYTDVIIILDLNSKLESLKNVKNMYEMFRFWDPNCKHGKIMALKGGFMEWLNMYPTLVTNTNIKLPDIQKNNVNEILNNVVYNDLMDFVDDEHDKISLKSVQIKPVPLESHKNSISTKSVLKNSTTDQIRGSMKLPTTLTENKHMRIYGNQNGNLENKSINQPKDFVDKQAKIVLTPIFDRSCKPGQNQKSESLPLLNIKRQLLAVVKQQLKVEREIYDLQKILYTDHELSNSDKLNIQEKLKELKVNQNQVIEEKTNYKNKLEQIPRDANNLSNSTMKNISDMLDINIGSAEHNLKSISINLIELQKEMKANNLNVMKPKEEEIHKEPLKSDGFSTNSGLKRSHSSPNLAQMDERKVPPVDRSSKPQINQQNRSSIDNRNTKYLTLNRVDREQRMDPVYRSVKSYPGITGLKNLGNSCYMNSIIQCLSNTETLAKYFNDDRYVDDLNVRNKSGTQGQVAEEVAQVIKALWRGQYKSITPRDLKIVIGQYKLQFESKEQQDSHEFLIFLLEWMHNDLKKEDTIKNEMHLSNAEKEWNKAMSNQTSMISRLFFGQLRSRIYCNSCENNSTIYEIFNTLTISLSHSSKCTLDECIKKYLSGQKVSGWKCPHCKVPREATKKFDFVKLSPIIVIHLNRFGESDGWIEKKSTAVDFPLTDFNLGQYVVRDTDTGSNYKQSNYSLYAMSNHYGTMDGGHYTAFCKSATQDKWYKYDDQTVTEVTKSTVKSEKSSAYLLFYSSLSDRIHRIDT